LRDAGWGAQGPIDLDAAAQLAGGIASVTGYARGWRGEHVAFRLDTPMRLPGPNDHVALKLAVTGVRVRDLHGLAGVVDAGQDRGRTWLVARAEADHREILALAGTSAADWRTLGSGGTAAMVDRPPPFALTLGRLDLRAIAAAGAAPAETEGIVSGVVSSAG